MFVWYNYENVIRSTISWPTSLNLCFMLVDEMSVGQVFFDQTTRSPLAGAAMKDKQLWK
jgi:hypothetical protein